MDDVLRLRARIAAVPSAVHAALTSGPALRTWLAGSAEIDPAAHRFEFWGRHTPQGERGRQRLVAVEPDAGIVFEWTLDGRPTTVTIRLRADGAGTALDLEQDGQPAMAELMAPPGRRDGLHSMHTFWPLAIANLAEHVEGRELTPKADFTAGRANEVRVEFAVAAPPEQVWASLVDPQTIEKWFGWAAEVEPHVGGRMGVGVDGKIFEFEPPDKLVYGDAEGAVVRWELAGSAGRTHLTFVQSGYTEDEWDDAAQHEAGWLAAFAQLKRMHELGDGWTPLIVDIPEGDQPSDSTAT